MLIYMLNLKRLGEGGGGRWDQFDALLTYGFSKFISSKEREKTWFFVTFNVILRHIFPENFKEFPQVVQKM